MAVSLSKGMKVNLTKDNPGLKKLFAKLYWDKNIYDSGTEADLDGSAFMTSGGRCLQESDFIFYKNLKHPSGAITHSGDVRQGSSSGSKDDGELISVELALVPDKYDRIAITVTINDYETTGHNFGQIQRAGMEILDENKNVLYTFDFSEDFSQETAIVAGEIYRHNGDWKFDAVAKGWNGGLAALCNNYGIDVE